MSALTLEFLRALRALRRTPYVTGVAILSIGIAVGSATAVYSWLDGLVLRPFPAAREQQDLIGIEVGGPNGGMGAWSYPTYKELRAATAGSFTGLVAWRIVRVSTREPSERGSTPLLATTVSDSYFDVLGVKPVVGRAITTADVEEIRPVAVLGYQYWMDRYKGDSGVVGRTLLLNGQAVTVIGVAPPRFSGIYTGVVPHFYVPITIQPLLTGVNQLTDRKFRNTLMFGRLAPGVSLEAATANIDAIAKHISAGYGDRPVLGAITDPLRVEFLGRVLSPLFTAMLAVATVLVVLASANVAGLLLVRSSARRGEVALRRALGGTAWQVVRVSLIEAAVISVAGAAVGVAATYGARGLLYAFVPRGAFPISLPIAISWRVLGVALAGTAIVTALSGIAPALAALRVDAGGVFTSVRLVGGRTRLQSAIVAGQLALCVVALTLAGMFAQGLRSAASVDVGFSDAAHVLLVDTDFTPARFSDTTGIAALGQLLRKLRALPGVESASTASMVPLGFGGRRIVEIKVEGFAPAPGDNMSTERAHVASDYAATMRIRMIAGRDIRDDDRVGAEQVAVVNEAFVKRFFPVGDPIGRRVDVGRGWARVVGVLHDGKYDRLEEPLHPVVYIPMAQWFLNATTIHLRTNPTTDPRSLAEPVRQALLAIHADIPALQPRTLEEHTSASTFVPRTGTELIGAAAVIAALLSAVGLYGALAFSVMLRQREIAVRRALGAANASITGEIARRALTVVGTGLVAGLVLAVVAGRLMRAQVATMGNGDALTWTGAVIALALVGLAAALAPTRTALRVHPAAALRGE